MILHLKLKVVNVLAKTWFTKTNFANTYIKNAQFNLSYQYMLLLTKVKQFSNSLEIKKEIGVTL